MKVEHLATVLENRRLNSDNVLLELHVPELAASAKPGQFVDLEAGQFLRRPFGISMVDPERGSISVGFLVKGEGTKWLQERRVGDTISLLGPLGHGFEAGEKRRVLVLGGGTGIYPLIYLLDSLRKQGIETATAFGFRSEAQFILEDECRSYCDQVIYATEDGSAGTRGNVIYAAKAVLAESSLFERVAPEDCVIMACGPTPMLLAVAALAHELGVDCQVSLEERMACGIGYCRTCSCKAKTGEGEDDWNYERVCIEGPVFPAERVFFG